MFSVVEFCYGGLGLWLGWRGTASVFCLGLDHCRLYFTYFHPQRLKPLSNCILTPADPSPANLVSLLSLGDFHFLKGTRSNVELFDRHVHVLKQKVLHAKSGVCF